MLEVMRHTKQRHRKRLKKNLPEEIMDEDETSLEQRIAELEAEKVNDDETDVEREESFESEGEDSSSDY